MTTHPASASDFAVGSAYDLGVGDDQIRRFWDKHWPRSVAITLPTFYDWQFKQPPSNGGKDAVVVALLDGEIYGALGLNEHAFELAGVPRTCAVLTTWILAPEAKGRGLGQRIIHDVQRRYDAIIGSGISEAALSIYLQSGIGYMKYMPRYFRIFDVEAVRPHARITPLGEKLVANRLQRGPSTSARAVQVTAAALADIAGASLAGRHHCARDAAQLHWRYDDHPVFTYESFQVGDAAGVILRRDQVGEMKFAHVVDVFAADDPIADVLGFIDTYARNHGLAAVDFSCTLSSLIAPLGAHGWFSSVDEPMFQFLNLFHPPELRDSQTTSLIYWAKDAQAKMADMSNLYLVKGDADMDRPTIAYYEERGLPLR